ncbi:hypothetical protein [Paraburkholderia lacunae]|uniref:DUF2917 domain-containing protein n=1 Tax=Paraburkholderia lacunae TaxID=2211104 RepID=A0A370NE76_9BURK|nr:hypothetical protein [Paraburkholderia lacunae]RDK03858.1 hypothetical protein DLM46_06560 [Paraburkholderia lacunae]
MPALQSRASLPRETASSRLRAGQVTLLELREQTSIVAVEGNLQLGFRDHSLAWLGDTVMPTWITVHEGEQYVTPQRGVVSISAALPRAAAFLVQPQRPENNGFIRQIARSLSNLVRILLRSPA